MDITKTWQKKVSFMIALAFIACLYIIPASALEVIPGYSEIIFEPNTHKTIELLIRNSQDYPLNVLAYAEGPLSEYVLIPQSVVEIPAKGEKKISYELDLPASFEKQGLHESNIVIREIPSVGGSAVSSSVAVISEIRLMVPYQGKYLESKLIVPEFEPGRGSTFSVEVQNLGTEWIEDAQAVIDIYGPFNEKITTLTSNTLSLDPKEKQLLFIKWNPDVSYGMYRAVSTVIYDEKNSVSEKTFTIGSLALAIAGITVDEFKLGGIAKFGVIAQSFWNMPVEDAYVKASVRDYKGKLYTSFKTASEEVPPYGRQIFESYWDTAKVGVGSYNLSIEMNYAGKTTSGNYDIFVDTNMIRIESAVGMVTKDAEDKSSIKTILILLLLVTIVILVLAFRILVMLKKRQI